MTPKVRRLLPRLLMVAAVTASVLVLSFAQGSAAPGLRNVTVLIVRHAEKPEVGRELNARGEQRAAAYADYFTSLQLDDQTLTPQRLIATRQPGKHPTASDTDSTVPAPAIAHRAALRQ